MTVTVNGKKEEVAEHMTLTEYIAQKQYKVEYIAIERNGAIVPKAEYDSVTLCSGDEMEVVSFVGGG